MTRFVSLLLTLIQIVLNPCCNFTPDSVVWSDEAVCNTSGTYPRFASLKSGAVLMCASSSAHISYDSFSTWESLSLNRFCSAFKVTQSGRKHHLVNTNFQPFVLPDGSLILAYRSHTANYVNGSGDEFYTSIRVIYGSPDGKEYFGEQILIEATANSFNGFWEPFMIMLDSDTVALYYSDDLNVSNPASQQNINYLTYSISKNEWNTEIRTAINGEKRSSRDGMPSVAKLKDGSFAMVFESFDYNNRRLFPFTLRKLKCPFVIAVSLSEDGINWSNPVPIAAPDNLRAGFRCAAPFIASLPDGRILVSYMTDEYYVGERNPDPVLNSSFEAVISKAPVTSKTKFVPSSSGAAAGFEKAESLFTKEENSNMIWNIVFCTENQIFAAGRYSSSTFSGIKIRTAQIISE